MKKILYLIPLFIFIFLISPSNVFAASYHYTQLEISLTDSQKQEYLSYVFNSEEFKSSLSSYPYYIIVYQQKNKFPLDHPASHSYSNSVVALMFPEHPSFNSSDSGIAINNINYMDYSAYSMNINSLTFTDAMFNVYTLAKYTSYADSTYYENLYLDYVIATNLEYVHSKDMNIYDAEGNLIKTITKGENIFSNLNIKPEIPEETIEPVIDSILNSEDTLYSLSKQLLGELPEEFTFLYSICQLFLGIVIILVVLSPVILLLRLFR